MSQHPPERVQGKADEQPSLPRAWVTTIVTTVIAVALAVPFVASVGTGAATGHEHLPGAAEAATAPEPDPDEAGSYPTDPPPFKTEEVLDALEEYGKPCSGCHDEDMPANPERRELDAHEDVVLKHDEEHRWCLDCHDADNRDKLRLASGALVDFSESHRLCGQCHGAKYRDWRAGIHGRRTGSWNGAKEYRLCVHCHWAHAPRFAPIEPLPPPKRPEDAR